MFGIEVQNTCKEEISCLGLTWYVFAIRKSGGNRLLGNVSFPCKNHSVRFLEMRSALARGTGVLVVPRPELLRAYQTTRCEVIQDRVFSLVSIATGEPFKLDYSLSLCELFGAIASNSSRVKNTDEPAFKDVETIVKTLELPWTVFLIPSRRARFAGDMWDAPTATVTLPTTVQTYVLSTQPCGQRFKDFFSGRQTSSPRPHLESQLKPEIGLFSFLDGNSNKLQTFHVRSISHLVPSSEYWDPDPGIHWFPSETVPRPALVSFTDRSCGIIWTFRNDTRSGRSHLPARERQIPHPPTRKGSP